MCIRDRSRGPVATVLVQKGTLRQGDYVVTGSASGRIRAMFDSKGKPIKKAGPSIPAQILGLSDVAEAGDKIYAVKDEKVAREYADRAAEFKREELSLIHILILKSRMKVPRPLDF